MSQTKNTQSQSAAPAEPYFFDILNPPAKYLTHAQLDEQLFDKFVYVDPKGKSWTKEQVIANLLSGEHTFDVLEQSDIEVINFGQEAAHVQRSTFKIKGGYLGRELEGNYRCASMVVNDGESWKLFNFQLTKMV